MTIAEAIEAVAGEYDRECAYAEDHDEFDALMRQTLHAEYKQIDRHLPSYVTAIARVSGVPVGTQLPQYVYQIARMCFRMGMRAQRKLDDPEQETTIFWQSGEATTRQ
jgi:hypothetical protein